MKNAIISLLIIMLFVKCDSPDIRRPQDSVWNLEFVSKGTETNMVKNDKYHNDQAYKLLFFNDTVFQLNTSINTANGKYIISSGGKIMIYYYHELSEMGGHNKVDSALLQYLPTVTSYKIKNKRLYFHGDNCKIVFKMEK